MMVWLPALVLLCNIVCGVSPPPIPCAITAVSDSSDDDVGECSRPVEASDDSSEEEVSKPPKKRATTSTRASIGEDVKAMLEAGLRKLVHKSLCHCAQKRLRRTQNSGPCCFEPFRSNSDLFNALLRDRVVLYNMFVVFFYVCYTWCAIRCNGLYMFYSVMMCFFHECSCSVSTSYQMHMPCPFDKTLTLTCSFGFLQCCFLHSLCSVQKVSTALYNDSESDY